MQAGSLQRTPEIKNAPSGILKLIAEKEGFEPPVPEGTTVFKTAALDRSAISPGAKVGLILKTFGIQNQNSGFFR